jgi:triosephosphate isomerase
MICPIVIGNWKMHKTIGESADFAAQLCRETEDLADLEIVIAPPFTALKAVSELLRNSAIGLAAQNLHEQKQGAFTGEISGPMLIDVGCTYVIIGHSERRIYFGESDDQIHAKIQVANQCGLKPILCIGETLHQRDEDKTINVIERQLKQALHDLDFSDISRLVIAYEPVWAIGTGRTASPSQAQEVHWFIRQWLQVTIGEQAAQTIRIIYGGSVNQDNIGELMSQHDINGALVGGASLILGSFVRIIRFYS